MNTPADAELLHAALRRVPCNQNSFKNCLRAIEDQQFKSMKLSLYETRKGSTLTAIVATASVACIGLAQQAHAGVTWLVSESDGDLLVKTDGGSLRVAPAQGSAYNPNATYGLIGANSNQVMVNTSTGGAKRWYQDLGSGAISGNKPWVLGIRGNATSYSGDTISIGLAPNFAKPKDSVNFRNGAVDPFSNTNIYEGAEDTMILQNNDAAGQRNQNYGARAEFFVGEASAANGFWPRRSLIRYDLSSLAGEYEKICRVTLRPITAAEDNDEIRFHSSEAASLEDRPELIIEFVPIVPTLTIAKVSNSVRVSWLGGGTRWTLHQSTDLVEWNPITQIPKANGEAFHVDFPADMPKQFFRIEQH
jgi:hypothetical protein